MQHIDEMYYLREKVSLYGYAQIDPLVIYKKEAFEKFQRLLFTIKKETLAQVLRFDFAGQQTATDLASQITADSHGQFDMMAVLKQVTAGLTAGSLPVSPSPAPKTSSDTLKNTSSSDGVEVIEIQENDGTDYQTTRTSKKLRPNDKVNVQYADGKIEYGVKWKKIKDEVDA